MSTLQPTLTWPLTPEQMALVRQAASRERAKALTQLGRGIAKTVKRLFQHRPTRTQVGRVARQGG